MPNLLSLDATSDDKDGIFLFPVIAHLLSYPNNTEGLMKSSINIKMKVNIHHLYNQLKTLLLDLSCELMSEHSIPDELIISCWWSLESGEGVGGHRNDHALSRTRMRINVPEAHLQYHLWASYVTVFLQIKWVLIIKFCHSKHILQHWDLTTILC